MNVRQQFNQQCTVLMGLLRLICCNFNIVTFPAFEIFNRKLKFITFLLFNWVALKIFGSVAKQERFDRGFTWFISIGFRCGLIQVGAINHGIAWSGHHLNNFILFKAAWSNETDWVGIPVKQFVHDVIQDFLLWIIIADHSFVEMFLDIAQVAIDEAANGCVCAEICWNPSLFWFSIRLWFELHIAQCRPSVAVEMKANDWEII